jgi:hypothetical protein
LQMTSRFHTPVPPTQVPLMLAQGSAALLHCRVDAKVISDVTIAPVQHDSLCINREFAINCDILRISNKVNCVTSDNLRMISYFQFSSWQPLYTESPISTRNMSSNISYRTFT